MAKNRLIWVAVLFVFALTLLVILKPSWGQQPSSSAKKSMDPQELQNEKLQQELLKLQAEVKKLNSFWGRLLDWVPFITALVALIGVLFTIWRQRKEMSRQQELDRYQRELNRKQREDDSLRRLDENFTSIVTNLGSESTSMQASAAVSIITFLKPEYKVFHNQVFMMLLANLKIEYSDAVNKLLIEAFEKAIRIKLQSAQETDEPFELNLSRSNLYRVDLSGLDLSQADVAFAQLPGANLTDTDLRRARGIEANLEKARFSRANLEEVRFQKARFKEAQFHEANLVSAVLKEADLRNAQFQQAKMQSAHLEKTELNGAKFEQANLNDTFFYGASFNEETLKSILKAFNWQKAHFDKDVRDTLEELAKK